MSRGIPVITYAIGALPELITHEHNGWLVPAGDENAFHQAINKWLALNEAQHAALAVAASKHIRQHYIDDVVCPRILGIYRSALSARREPAAHIQDHRL
jgi:glycosyltransferase involved in cell wall biosynthesis